MHINFYIGCIGLLLVAACNAREPVVSTSATDFCLNETLRDKIRIDTLLEQPVTQHVNLTGEVTYNPDKVVQFVSLIAGVTVSTGFSLGDYVEQGQVMATIKSPELNALLAERNSLDAQTRLATRELAAAKSLFDDHISSERDLLRAELELEKLTADLATVSASLRLFNPNERNGTFEILAPTSGYVVEKNINPGMQLHGDQHLFTISGLDEVWVMINVYATDMQFVRQGMDVDIRTLAYPDDVFRGTISALSQVFDNEERVLKGRVVLKNTGLRLKPGMSADISVERRTGQRAVAIPADAVIFDDNHYFAVVYGGDCSLHVRRITFTAKDNDWYFVDEGLAAGEQVVCRNHLLVYEKIKAR